MSNLTHWRQTAPARWNRDLFEEIDRYFDEPFAMLRRPFAQQDNWGLSLDVAEEDNNYVVKASLPGMKPEDIDVTLTDNVLTIKGEMKKDDEVKEENYFLRERRYGAFSRSVTLPAAVDPNQIEAHYDQGVLTLRLPKSEAVRPKRISIQTNGQSDRKVIENRAKQ